MQNANSKSCKYVLNTPIQNVILKSCKYILNTLIQNTISNSCKCVFNTLIQNVNLKYCKYVQSNDGKINNDFTYLGNISSKLTSTHLYKMQI